MLTDAGPKEYQIRVGVSAFGLALVAGVLAYLSSVYVFHQAPLTTDENSYLFQAVNFSEGRIAREAPPFPKAFAHRMIIQDPEAGWLSRYPPLHALWLVPGIWLGDPYLMSALAAALSVLLMVSIARSSIAGPGAWVAPVLLVVSPYFIFMHGSLLSHTSGMLAVNVMLWGYLRWRETGRWSDALVAGCGWGLLCLNRTYTALCMCAPLALDALWLWWGQRNMVRFRGVLLFAGGAAAGVLLLLCYNALAIGDFLRMTYLFYDPSEKLGFGLRHTQGIPVDHTFAKGLESLVENVTSLDRWLLGVPFGLALVLLLTLMGRCRRLGLLLLGCTACVWVGYVYFWYPGIRDAGPVYYMETLPFLVLGAAGGVARLHDGLAKRLVLRNTIWAIAGLALAFAAPRFAFAEGARLSQTLSARARLRAVIDAAPPRALVFIPRIAETDYLVLNAHGLDSDPLVAHSMRGQNMAVVKYFKDRVVYRLEPTPAPRLVAHEEAAALHFELSGVNFHRHTGANETLGDRAVRLARRGEHAPGTLAFGKYAQPYPGRLECYFDMTVSGGASNAVGAIVRIVSDAGRTLLHEECIVGDLPEGGLSFELPLRSFAPIEAQVVHTGAADIALRRIVIRERPTR